MTPSSAKPRWLVLTLLAVCLVPLILPGDAPWINDEPQLLAMAQKNNVTPGHFLGIPIPFTIGERGLQGNRGAIYGPVAVWFYQIELAIFPHNLELLATVRAVVVTALTAAALVWLSESAGLSFGMVPVLMLSPWMWFYSRQMWDNSFLIPVSAMLLASYIAFLKTRSRRAFATAALCALLMPLIHLMALAIVLPVSLHLLVREWRWALRFSWIILGVAVFIGLLVWPYINIFLASYHSGHLAGSSPWEGYLTPLLGAHHLSALGMEDLYGPDWIYNAALPWPFVMTVCVWVTGLAYVASWIGMLISFPAARRIWIKRQKGTVKDNLAAIAIGIWFCQTLLDGAERAYEFPHYHNATWIAYAIFVWLAVDALPKGKWLTLSIGAYVTSAVAVIAFALVQIHLNGGSRAKAYGPTVTNQQAIVDEMNRYSKDSIRDPQFPNWAEFKIAYYAIRILRPPKQSPEFPARLLVIRFRNAYPEDARIVMDVYAIPQKGK